MELHDALLQQARELVESDARRPRRVNLRRAVSAAYYALFHRLIADATSQQIGREPGSKALRHNMARWFDHATMSEVSALFSGMPRGAGAIRAKAAAVQRLLGHPLSPTTIVPKDLHDLAESFVKLQEARHEADYALDKLWKRAGAKAFVDRGEEAFSAIARLQGNPVYGLYLLMLLVGDAAVMTR